VDGVRAMKRWWWILPLVVVVAVLVGVRWHPQTSNANGYDPTPQPRFTAAGVLPLSSDGVLTLTGSWAGTGGGQGSLDMVALAVPALFSGVVAPIEFTFAVDQHSRILDQAGNDVLPDKQLAYMNAQSKGTWGVEARRMGATLILTQLQSMPSAELTAAQRHPKVVVGGLLDFNANGVARLWGSLNGFYGWHSGRPGEIELHAPLSLDGIYSIASFTLLAGSRFRVLDDDGIEVSVSKTHPYHPPEYADTTVRRLGLASLGIVTVKPSTAVTLGGQ
jgi:hypothetical protein